MTKERYNHKGGWGVDGVHKKDWHFLPEMNITSVVDDGPTPESMNGNLNQRTFRVSVEFNPPWKEDRILQVRWVMGKIPDGASNCLGIRSFKIETAAPQRKKDLSWIGYIFIGIGALVLLAAFFVVWRKYGNAIKHYYVEGYRFVGESDSENYEGVYDDVVADGGFGNLGKDDRFGTHVPAMATVFSAMRRGIKIDDEEEKEDEQSLLRNETVHPEFGVAHSPTGLHDPTTCLYCGQERKAT